MVKAFLALVLASVSSAFGDEIMLRVVKLEPKVIEGNGVTVAGSSIQAPIGKPALIQLASIVDPLIDQPTYAIKGAIRYSDIGGRGYLEMWNDFGGNQRYFSRTLGEAGPMAFLSGNSGVGPREFILPFNTLGKVGAPKVLEINLILPEGGKVEIPIMTLVQYVPVIPSPGWHQPWGSVIAAISGLFIVAVGFLTGILSRRFIGIAAWLAKIGLGFGIALFLAGLVAPLWELPVRLYYPALLEGLLAILLFLGLLWHLSKRRQKNELQRIIAMDAG